MASQILLFVPGGDQAKLAKAGDLPTSALIFDLEDAVAVSEKERARRDVAGVISAAPDGSQYWVRINDMQSEYASQDLEAVVRPGLRGIVLPKVEDGHSIAAANWFITALERQRGMPAGEVRIGATIESVAGIDHADDIASASPRLTWFGLGAVDFSADARLGTGQEGQPNPVLLHVRILMALASSRHGLEAPHDNAYVRFGDPAGLRREAELARGMGFGTKHAIHPDQIAVIDDVFGAGRAADLEWAKASIEAFEEAEAAGVANVGRDGVLIDYAEARWAARLVAAADEAPGSAPESE